MATPATAASGGGGGGAAVKTASTTVVKASKDRGAPVVDTAALRALLAERHDKFRNVRAKSHLLQGLLASKPVDKANSLRRLAKIHYQLWSTTLNTSHLLAAQQAYEEALKERENSSNPELWMEAAQVYMSFQALDGASKLLARIIMEFPLYGGLPRALYTAAAVYRRAKQFDHAITYFMYLLRNVLPPECSEADVMLQLAYTYELQAVTTSSRGHAALAVRAYQTAYREAMTAKSTAAAASTTPAASAGAAAGETTGKRSGAAGLLLWLNSETRHGTDTPVELEGWRDWRTNGLEWQLRCVKYQKANYALFAADCLGECLSIWSGQGSIASTLETLLGDSGSVIGSQQETSRSFGTSLSMAAAGSQAHLNLAPLTHRWTPPTSAPIRTPADWMAAIHSCIECGSMTVATAAAQHVITTFGAKTVTLDNAALFYRTGCFQAIAAAGLVASTAMKKLVIPWVAQVRAHWAVERLRAAKTIQLQFRLHRYRAQLQQRHAAKAIAALCLQSLYRGSAARLRVAKIRAAHELQRVGRGYLARQATKRRARRLHGAARRIQCAWRWRRTRQRVAARLQARRQALRQRIRNSIIKIQAWGRMIGARQRLRRVRHATLTLQCWARKCKAEARLYAKCAESVAWFRTTEELQGELNTLRKKLPTVQVDDFIKFGRTIWHRHPYTHRHKRSKKRSSDAGGKRLPAVSSSSKLLFASSRRRALSKRGPAAVKHLKARRWRKILKKVCAPDIAVVKKATKAYNDAFRGRIKEMDMLDGRRRRRDKRRARQKLENALTALPNRLRPDTAPQVLGVSSPLGESQQWRPVTPQLKPLTGLTKSPLGRPGTPQSVCSGCDSYSGSSVGSDYDESSESERETSPPPKTKRGSPEPVAIVSTPPPLAPVPEEGTEAESTRRSAPPTSRPVALAPTEEVPPSVRSVAAPTVEQGADTAVVVETPVVVAPEVPEQPVLPAEESVVVEQPALVTAEPVQSERAPATERLDQSSIVAEPQPVFDENPQAPPSDSTRSVKFVEPVPEPAAPVAVMPQPVPGTEPLATDTCTRRSAPYALGLAGVLVHFQQKLQDVQFADWAGMGKRLDAVRKSAFLHHRDCDQGACHVTRALAALCLACTVRTDPRCVALSLKLCVDTWQSKKPTEAARPPTTAAKKQSDLWFTPPVLIPTAPKAEVLVLDDGDVAAVAAEVDDSTVVHVARESPDMRQAPASPEPPVKQAASKPVVVPREARRSVGGVKSQLAAYEAEHTPAIPLTLQQEAEIQVPYGQWADTDAASVDSTLTPRLLDEIDDDEERAPDPEVLTLAEQLTTITTVSRRTEESRTIMQQFLDLFIVRLEARDWSAAEAVVLMLIDKMGALPIAGYSFFKKVFDACQQSAIQVMVESDRAGVVVSEVGTLRAPARLAALWTHFAVKSRAARDAYLCNLALEVCVVLSDWKAALQICYTMQQGHVVTDDRTHELLIQVCKRAPASERNEAMYAKLAEAGVPLIVCFAAAPKAVQTNKIMRALYETFCVVDNVGADNFVV